jgi:hypothetical protein
VRELLPVSDRVAGSKSVSTRTYQEQFLARLGFHLVRSVVPPYSMTELTPESPTCIVTKITVTKDRVPVENWQVYPIRTEHRQAVDPLGTFLPSRASDLPRPSSTRAYERLHFVFYDDSHDNKVPPDEAPSSFYLSSKADLVEINIDNTIPYSTDAFRPDSILTVSFSTTQKTVQNDSLNCALSA